MKNVGSLGLSNHVSVGIFYVNLFGLFSFARFCFGKFLSRKKAKDILDSCQTFFVRLLGIWVPETLYGTSFAVNFFIIFSFFSSFASDLFNQLLDVLIS